MGNDNELAQIEQELREWRAHQASEEPSTAGAEDTIDSLEGVELVLHAEEKWGVRVPDRDLGRISRSIHRIAVSVQARRQAQPTGRR